MKVVFLERASLGMDVDVSCVHELGEVTIYDTIEADRLTEYIRDAEAVFVNKAAMTGEVLAQAPNLKIIAEMATGFDNIDIHYCKEHGIAVANAGHYSTESVAQHTFALALYLLNNMPYYDRVVKDGTYTASGSFSIFDQTVSELTGKTWGIVGMGMIGQRVAKIAEAFGCRVVTWSASGRTSGGEYPLLTWDDFLAESDIISLHCPLSDRTRHLINAEALEKMKDSAILLNLARGPVVDQNALYDALVSGKIAAAGLDVLEQEPMTVDNPLAKINDSGKLVITPHMGWASLQARTRDFLVSFENVKAFLRGEEQNRIV